MYMQDAAIRDSSEVDSIVQSFVWVPKFDRLASVLDILNTVKGDIPGTTHVIVRDFQGEVTNRVTIEFAPEIITSIDLSLLVGGCREDNGLVHGLVEVRSPISFVHAFRLASDSESLPMRESVRLSRTAPFFSFLNTAVSSTSFFALLNLSNEEAEVQCRLYWERTYREIIKVVPPNGTRILRIEDDFEDALEMEKDQVPQYVRVSQKSERSAIAVQLIEKSIDDSGNCHYASFV
jgi:hypothetical protein